MDIESTPPDISKKKYNKKIVPIIAIVAIIGIAASYLIYTQFFNQRPPWLFKGAYAKYSGKQSILLAQLEITMRFEVLEFDNKFAKLLMYVKFDTGSFGSWEVQNTTTVDLEDNSMSIGGTKPTYKGEESIYIEALGTRTCTVWEYPAESGTMTMYVDKKTEFPVKMKFTMAGNPAYPQGFGLDLNLVETNIPELSK